MDNFGLIYSKHYKRAVSASKQCCLSFRHSNSKTNPILFVVNSLKYAFISLSYCFCYIPRGPHSYFLKFLKVALNSYQALPRRGLIFGGQFVLVSSCQDFKICYCINEITIFSAKTIVLEANVTFILL